MCLPVCAQIAFFPANTLETFAFGKKGLGEDHISNYCLRHLVRRLVALVAPLFHIFECGMSVIRIPFHLLTFCFGKDSLRTLLIDDEVGAIPCALNSIRDFFSSILEMPQKLTCGSSVNYFKRDGRYKYRID